MNLLDDIPAGVVVGLDTAPIIYHLEGHPDYGPLVAPLIAARVDPGLNIAVTSTISLAEVLVKPLRTGRADLVARFSVFLTGSAHLTSFRSPPHWRSTRQIFAPVTGSACRTPAR